MPPVTDLLDVLRRHEVTHVVGLPDNNSAPLFARLTDDQDTPTLVRITREGEAFALAAGLWMGGAVPMVVVQNTGLLESGDSLRGTAVRMRVPLVMLVGYRGYASALRAGIDLASPTIDADLLSRLGLDSTALVTQPTLRAWGIPFTVAGRATVAAEIDTAFNAAAEGSRPVAVLFTESLE